MEAEILKFVCSNQGSANTQDLMFNLYPGDSASVSTVLCNRERFAPWFPDGEPKVVARSRVRLCWARGCTGACQGLHLCKNYLFTGACHFTQLRRGCNFSHTLDSEHNQQILRRHDLQSLTRAELCTLLLQNDNTLLPAICFDYNNGIGEFGRCKDGDDCKRLHICEKYISNDCSCTKNHNFTAQQALKALQSKGIPDVLFRSLRSLYSNKGVLRIAARASDGGDQGGASNVGARSEEGSRQWVRGRGRGGNQGNRGNRAYRGNRGNGGNQGDRTNLSRASSVSDIFADLGLFDLSSGRNSPNDDMDTRSESGQSRRNTHHPHKTSVAARGRGGDRGNRPVRDKTEICMYFIKGFCKHDDEHCYKVHSKMPYRWEVNDGTQWTAMPENETIEKDYCDPKNQNSNTSSPVHFDTMTCGLNKVRRLSTVNSLIEPTFIHTTEWLWYWQDEFGNWNLYASDGGGHRPADMDSAKLEQKFLDNDKDEVEFSAGSQSYSLSFQDMIQTNKKYGTKRVVSRRPRFVSAEEVRTKKMRRPPLSSTTIPENWDRTQLPETGFSRIPLQRTSEEFKEIEALFCKTLTGYEVKIERIQNKALWEAYQLQKNQMKSRNSGRDVLEKKLFHGTDAKYLDAICHLNFDWRICGAHGTAFGKGSYFARDAKYSHSYTGASDEKAMFVCRVLVGDFTKGSPDYLRPPSKDGGDVNFYDSCVDVVFSPSIHVIFEKPQIYPEYLVQYKKKHPLVDRYDASSVTVQSLRSVAPMPTVGATTQATAQNKYIAPQPVITPKPVIAPKQVIAPKPVIAQKPVVAPRPAVPPRQSTTSQVASSRFDSSLITPLPRSYQDSTTSYDYDTLRSQSSYHRSGISFNPSTGSSSYSSSSTNRPSFSPPPSTPPPRKSSCVIA